VCLFIFFYLYDANIYLPLQRTCTWKLHLFYVYVILLSAHFRNNHSIYVACALYSFLLNFIVHIHCYIIVVVLEKIMLVTPPYSVKS
jgi:hypothetical protein